jgi:hypothetical protein
VAELVDAADLKSVVLTGVLVRLRPWPPFFIHMKNEKVNKLVDDIRDAETEVSWAEHKAQHADRRKWAERLKGLRNELKYLLVNYRSR